MSKVSKAVQCRIDLFRQLDKLSEEQALEIICDPDFIKGLRGADTCKTFIKSVISQMGVTRIIQFAEEWLVPLQEYAKKR